MCKEREREVFLCVCVCVSFCLWVVLRLHVVLYVMCIGTLSSYCISTCNHLCNLGQSLSTHYFPVMPLPTHWTRPFHLLSCHCTERTSLLY